MSQLGSGPSLTHERPQGRRLAASAPPVGYAGGSGRGGRRCGRYRAGGADRVAGNDPGFDYGFDYGFASVAGLILLKGLAPIDAIVPTIASIIMDAAFGWVSEQVAGKLTKK